jgi:chorismate mutase
MPVRGVRGATTVSANSREAILDATYELLDAIVQANQINANDIASALFTVTPDLDSAFPARAARDLGWDGAALIDAQAPHVAGDLPRCIRILVHWNTDRAAAEIRHVYLRDARHLRPDRVGGHDSAVSAELPPSSQDGNHETSQP